jgi:hypothetical protein
VCIMADKVQIPRSRLYSRTLELLRERPKPLTLAKIASDTGLTETWLWSIASQKTKNNDGSPQVDRVVVLYEYLTHRQLHID